MRNGEAWHNELRRRIRKNLVATNVKPEKSWLTVRPSGSSPEGGGYDLPGKHAAPSEVFGPQDIVEATISESWWWMAAQAGACQAKGNQKLLQTWADSIWNVKAGRSAITSLCSHTIFCCLNWIVPGKIFCVTANIRMNVPRKWY